MARALWSAEAFLWSQHGRLGQETTSHFSCLAGSWPVDLWESQRVLQHSRLTKDSQEPRQILLPRGSGLLGLEVLFLLQRELSTLVCTSCWRVGKR